MCAGGAPKAPPVPFGKEWTMMALNEDECPGCHGCSCCCDCDVEEDVWRCSGCGYAMCELCNECHVCEDDE